VRTSKEILDRVATETVDLRYNIEVLQRVAVCCILLQRVATCCSVL